VHPVEVGEAEDEDLTDVVEAGLVEVVDPALVEVVDEGLTDVVVPPDAGGQTGGPGTAYVVVV